MSIKSINAGSSVPVEQHFRVSAGPGAGKTRWLVSHIKNVLHQSTRLDKTRKIACITYTNVASEIVLRQLGATVDRVEVSTIHSFLYKHVVRPYAALIANEYSLNVQQMDGHDDHVIKSYSFLKELKSRTQQTYIRNDDSLVEAIQAAKWTFDKAGLLVVNTDYPRKVEQYRIRSSTYLAYKKLSWQRGVIHHDDVLFFGYQLTTRYPFILQVLRAKFPYFFVDEFQDTNPIQAEILKQIGQEETVVGIIGDKAQSIYGFQGADSSQLSSFFLNGIVEYNILENFRSTDKIIDFLNHVRLDLRQTKASTSESGENPILIVGEMGASIRVAQQLCHGEKLCSLTRDNITSNVLKRQADIDCPNEDLLKKLVRVDSNSERSAVTLSCIKALELAIQKRYSEAIKELSKILIKGEDETMGKKEVLMHLSLMLARYGEIQAMNLFDFHKLVKSTVRGSLASLTKGRAKQFYDEHTYKQLAVCVKITEDHSFNRTIHKAKGDEFDNVILVLKCIRDLSFVLQPRLDEDEEHRINYVAVSRARKRLFISVPSLLGLSALDKRKLSGILEIIEAS